MNYDKNSLLHRRYRTLQSVGMLGWHPHADIHPRPQSCQKSCQSCQKIDTSIKNRGDWQINYNIEPTFFIMKNSHPSCFSKNAETGRYIHGLPGVQGHIPLALIHQILADHLQVHLQPRSSFIHQSISPSLLPLLSPPSTLSLSWHWKALWKAARASWSAH